MGGGSYPRDSTCYCPAGDIRSTYNNNGLLSIWAASGQVSHLSVLLSGLTVVIGIGVDFYPLLLRWIREEHQWLWSMSVMTEIEHEHYIENDMESCIRENVVQAIFILPNSQIINVHFHSGMTVKNKTF